jgi:hypothetical protein
MKVIIVCILCVWVYFDDCSYACGVGFSRYFAPLSVRHRDEIRTLEKLSVLLNLVCWHCEGGNLNLFSKC